MDAYFVRVILSVLVWNRIFPKTKKSSFSPLFILKILPGQGTNEIQNVRFITGAWVVAGIFLANNYQGNNIYQLTTPFSPKKFETFGEILSNNFTVYSLPIWYEYVKVHTVLEKGDSPESHYEYFYGLYWNPS